MSFPVRAERKSRHMMRQRFSTSLEANGDWTNGVGVLYFAFIDCTAARVLFTWPV